MASKKTDRPRGRPKATSEQILKTRLERVYWASEARGRYENGEQLKAAKSHLSEIRDVKTREPVTSPSTIDRGLNEIKQNHKPKDQKFWFEEQERRRKRIAEENKLTRFN